MNKTLHQKLTEKHLYKHTPAAAYAHAGTQHDLLPEMQMLREAAKDLLQPRGEAIANILRLAKSI